jgi:hypothetical protein
MIASDHECSWSRRKTTDLIMCDGALRGWGLTLPALQHAATIAGSALVVSPISDDEDTVALQIGLERGMLHDGCISWFDHPSDALLKGLISAVVETHAAYLGADAVPPGVPGCIRDRLHDNTTVRVTTKRRPGRVIVSAFPVGSSWLRCRLAPKFEFSAEAP